MFGSRPKTLALTPRFIDVGGGDQHSSNQNQLHIVSILTKVIETLTVQMRL